MIGGDAGGGAPSGDAGLGAASGGGVLYVVATPIGNLSDVTLRALEVLAAVPLIAAEDTRLSKRLLDRHGISGRLTSYHARSGPGRLATLLEHLRGGADLALITDAGTPGGQRSGRRPRRSVGRGGWPGRADPRAHRPCSRRSPRPA